MKNYDAVQQCLNSLDVIEMRLKSLRDNVSADTKEKINNALRVAAAMYQPLHDIDKSLQETGMGAEEI